MKISTAILATLNACASGFSAFKKVHGDKEILFSECVKSESNTLPDCFWFIRRQPLTADHKKDLQLLAIEFAERVLPIFESKYQDDKRPRAAIETAKLYLSGESTLDALTEDRMAAYAAVAADSAAIAVAYAVAAADATDAVAAAAGANGAAIAANGANDAAEISWQKQRLAELMAKWGW